MTYEVTTGGAIALGETDTAASILQNVAVILATRKGSCPLYREFGLPMDMLDKPMPAAKTLAYAAIKEAVETYEPRATVTGVDFSQESGRLSPIVEVRIADE